MKRRTEVAGIFPNDGFIIRLISALLSEPDNEWQTRNPYIQVAPMAEHQGPKHQA